MTDDNDDIPTLPSKLEIANKAYEAITGIPTDNAFAKLKKTKDVFAQAPPTPLADAVLKERERAAHGIPWLDMTKEPEPIDWLIEGWLAKKDVLLLAGQAGGGKSTTAVDLAIALATRNGDGWMGGKITNAPVLYLDEEAGKDEITRQFHRQGGKKLDNIWVSSNQGYRLDDQKTIDKLEYEIKDKQPG